MDAAAAVFAELSFHGASTQDIADRLGIRQASLYYYVKSKEDALAEVCRVGVEGFLEAAQGAAASGLGAAEKIAAIIACHLKPIDLKPAYVKVFLRERRHLPATQARAIARIARAYEEVIERVIREGVAKGEFVADTDARLATLALLGMCNEATRWVNTDRGADVESTAQAFTGLLLKGLVRRS